MVSMGYIGVKPNLTHQTMRNPGCHNRNGFTGEVAEENKTRPAEEEKQRVKGQLQRIVNRKSRRGESDGGGE